MVVLVSILKLACDKTTVKTWEQRWYIFVKYLLFCWRQDKVYHVSQIRIHHEPSFEKDGRTHASKLALNLCYPTNS